MGFFSSLFGAGASREEMATAAALVISAAYGDDEISNVENKVINKIAKIEDWDSDIQQRAFELMHELHDENFSNLVLPKSSDGKKNLFRHVVQVVICDGIATEIESQYLNAVAAMIGLDDDSCVTILTEEIKAYTKAHGEAPVLK